MLTMGVEVREKTAYMLQSVVFQEHYLSIGIFLRAHLSSALKCSSKVLVSVSHHSGFKFAEYCLIQSVQNVTV